MRLDLEEITEHLLRHGFSGENVDKGVLVFAKTKIPEQGFLGIKLKSSEAWKVMAARADKTFYFCENKIFYIVAYYAYGDYFPIGRCYALITNDLDGLPSFLRNLDDGQETMPFYSSTQIYELTGQNNYLERIKQFKANHAAKEKGSKTITQIKHFFEGRRASTIVEKGIHIDTGNACIVCKEGGQLVSTTYEAGLMFTFLLCKKCLIETDKYDSFTSFMYHSIGKTESPFAFSDLAQSDVLKFAIIALTGELGCGICKIDQNTLTGIRKSRFKVILRLDAFDNYGYIILNHMEKEVAKFDSAKHHPIEFGPDHLHMNINKNSKKEVVPSFTIGFPYFDFPAIKKIILKCEQEAGFCPNDFD